MVGFPARAGDAAFDCVEPVHVQPLPAAPALCKVVGESRAAGTAGEEVGIERQHNIGLVELVVSVNGLSEDPLRTGPRGMPTGGLILMPSCLRKRFQDCHQLCADAR